MYKIFLIRQAPNHASFRAVWISFDLDGTLFDWPFGRVVFKRLREEFTTPELDRAFQAEYRRRFASSQPVRAFDWDNLHDQVCDLHGVPRLPRILELAQSCYWDKKLIYPDTRAALAKLDARGYLLALGTNGFARYQNYVLEQYELPFGVALAPDSTGFVKPQKEFLQALPELSGDPEALDGLIHVGDLLSHDIACANNAGVRGAWVWRTMPTHLAQIPPLERPDHPEFRAAAQREWQHELQLHGAFSPNETEPKPDFIVQDLLELTLLLEVPTRVRAEH
ncbi:MAG: HAD family hydrolase [Deinococcales bacterium]